MIKFKIHIALFIAVTLIISTFSITFAEEITSSTKLIDKLIKDKVVDEDKAIEVGAKEKLYGLKDGETRIIKNASNVKMSSDGKVVVWEYAGNIYIKSIAPLIK